MCQVVRLAKLFYFYFLPPLKPKEELLELTRFKKPELTFFFPLTFRGKNPPHEPTANSRTHTNQLVQERNTKRDPQRATGAGLLQKVAKAKKKKKPRECLRTCRGTRAEHTREPADRIFPILRIKNSLIKGRYQRMIISPLAIFYFFAFWSIGDRWARRIEKLQAFHCDN
jgi:hypothetical protein